MKDNPYRIDVIAFRGGGSDPKFILDFIEQYADRDQGFESTLLNKLIGIYDDLGWEFVNFNENASKFFKFD